MSAHEAVATFAALRAALSDLRFAAPVTHVYSPLDYAWEPARLYLERYARPGVQALLLGMNPGPFGMGQTGVPFGSVPDVRDWLGIAGPVAAPAHPHPKRPVAGFACGRVEGSGRRLWGWARATYGTPQRFFRDFFVANYCPLLFMEEGGRNRTPDKLPRAEQQPLLEACDVALRRLVGWLRPQRLVGVGAFAAARARAVGAQMGLPCGQILHPSPASPQANRGWAPQAVAQLRGLGISLPG